MLKLLAFACIYFCIKFFGDFNPNVGKLQALAAKYVRASNGRLSGAELYILNNLPTEFGLVPPKQRFLESLIALLHPVVALAPSAIERARVLLNLLWLEEGAAFDLINASVTIIAFLSGESLNVLHDADIVLNQFLVGIYGVDLEFRLARACYYLNLISRPQFSRRGSAGAENSPLKHIVKVI